MEKYMRMPFLLAAVIAISILITPSVHAKEKPFFVPFESAILKPEFVKLAAYLKSNPNEPEPDECFCLNRYEFLLTVTNAGRIQQGLYYFNAQNEKMEQVGSAIRENIKIFKEFIGPNKKRFVLLQSSFSRHGYGVVYTILQLVPKSEGSYALTELLYSFQSPWVDDDICDNFDPGEAKGWTVQEPTIYDVGKASVRLEFQITEENCKTMEHTEYKRIFILHYGKFVESTENQN
jgi:hypothetical protein